jgi:predicted hydrocarbon binding protein
MSEAILPDDTLAFRNYYSDDYLETNVRTGVTQNRAGTRLLALSSDFLIGLHQALTMECGEAAHTVFRTCGKSWGRQFGVKFEQELTQFYGRNLREFPVMLFEACLKEAFSRHGWGQVEVDYSHYEHGVIVVDLPSSIYVDLLGRQATEGDPLMMGLLAGLFSHLSGQNLEALQTQNKAKGEGANRYILTLPYRIQAAQQWLDQGKKHEDILAALERDYTPGQS